MERSGVVISKIYLPSKIKIEVEKLDDVKWSLQYIESFKDELPEEACELTIETAKRLGVEIKRRGNTFSYKFVGSIQQVAGTIAGEFIQFTNLGKITLTELLALSAIALANLPEMPKFFAAKEH